MKIKAIILNYLIIAPLLFGSLSAQEGSSRLTVDNASLRIDPIPVMSVWQDANGTATIAQVSELPEQDFTALAADTNAIQIIEPRQVVWLKIPILNTTDKDVRVTLETRNVLLRSMKIYQRTGSTWESTETGNALPFDSRATQTYPLTLEWTVPPSEQDFYLRVESGIAGPVPLNLYTGQAYLDASSSSTMIAGILIGVGLGLALFHFFIYYQTRDVVYLAFVATILFGTGYRAYYEGVGQSITTNWLWWNEVAFYVCLGFYLATILWFHSSYLKLKTVSPRMNLVTIGWAWAYVFTVTIVLGFGVTLGAVFELSLVALPVYLLSSALSRAIQGYRPAKLYFCALAFPLGTGFLAALFSFNDLLTPEAFRWVERLGSIVALMFFTLGLSDRINLLNQEKQEAEARATQASLETRMKSEFLARMSHEIRTPMNGVLGMSQLLSKSGLNQEQSQYNEVILSSGSTLLKVINDLLDFSKAEAGKLDVEDISFDLHTLLTDMESVFKSQNLSSGVALILDIEKGLPRYVSGDPTRIRQVLLNLIGNAFKFTAQGSVTLKVTLTDDEKFLFAITDTGIGISGDDMSHLFQSFSQASTSTTREYGGTGLGLAICKQITETMGGHIWVESAGLRADGNGTVQTCKTANNSTTGSSFKFTLPLNVIANSSLNYPQTEEIVGTPGNQDLQILIAEDNSVNQMVVKGMLKKLGHSVTIASDGGKALELATTQYERWDVILMDCEMPVLDGYETARQIREFEQAHKLACKPIVALTAHAIDGSEQRCMDAGMNAHVTKPVQSHELAETLLECKVSGRQLSETFPELHSSQKAAN